MDILATTPRRIADLLCPEISDSELKAIRRRVYDTVVLGLGTNASANAASLEKDDNEIPVAAKQEVETFQKCNTCGNNDQASFILDRKNGDLICTNCGTVVSESIMHEGSQYRKFEGEEDRNHHGDAPNPLFSNSHNMATTLGGMSFQTGAGMGGYGTGSRGGIENILRNAHAYTGRLIVLPLSLLLKPPTNVCQSCSRNEYKSIWKRGEKDSYWIQRSTEEGCFLSGMLVLFLLLHPSRE